MRARHRFCLGSSLLLVCVVGCDRSHPVEPVFRTEAAGATGPAVKAPSNANAVALSDTRIDVSWRDNSSNEIGFEVHRSTAGPSGAFTLLASTGAGSARYGDAGLTPARQYCYKVRAFRRADGKTGYSAYSNTVCATTPVPPVPAAPSAADAKPANSTTVDVRWIDNSTNEGGFRVQRSLDLGSTWTMAETTGPNVTAFSDGGRASEQQICYRVIAFNAGGDSPPSSSDCTTPPAGATGLTATGLAGPTVDLAWTDNSAVEDGYEVQRAAGGGAFSTVADLPANSTSYHDATLTGGTYGYQVRARKDAGFSDVSRATACAPIPEICGNALDDDCDGWPDVTDPEDCPCEVQECMSAECPPGYLCGYDGCCLSHCSDGVRDGDESDVDCGASCGQTCQSGQHCYGFWDCASGVCVNAVCQP